MIQRREFSVRRCSPLGFLYGVCQLATMGFFAQMKGSARNVCSFFNVSLTLLRVFLYLFTVTIVSRIIFSIFYPTGSLTTIHRKSNSEWSYPVKEWGKILNVVQPRSQGLSGQYGHADKKKLRNQILYKKKPGKCLPRSTNLYRQMIRFL